MTRRQMETIAVRAARLAENSLDEEDRPLFDYQDYYKEYMDQLESGDDDALKWWLGSKAEEGVQEAAEIRKMWLKGREADEGKEKTMTKKLCEEICRSRKAETPAAGTAGESVKN